MTLKNFALVFGIGASLGAAVALLYAPQTGVVTRKKLKRGAEDAADYLEDAAGYLKEQAEKLTGEAQKIAKKTKGQFDDYVDQAGELVAGAVKSAKSLV
jgi:gas vesicle protein